MTINGLPLNENEIKLLIKKAFYKSVKNLVTDFDDEVIAFQDLSGNFHEIETKMDKILKVYKKLNEEKIWRTSNHQ